MLIRAGLEEHGFQWTLFYHDFDDYEYKTIRTKVQGLVHDTHTKFFFKWSCLCNNKESKRRLFRKAKWVTKFQQLVTVVLRQKFLEK